METKSKFVVVVKIVVEVARALFPIFKKHKNRQNECQE